MLANADIEPDADRDGYGDETQDLCSSDASTQGACPAKKEEEMQEAQEGPGREGRHYREAKEEEMQAGQEEVARLG